MESYRFFEISGNATSEEVAFQVLYYSEIERRTDSFMGWPGKLSQREVSQLDHDIRIANNVLVGKFIRIGQKSYTFSEFISNVLDKQFSINFANNTISKNCQSWTFHIK